QLRVQASGTVEPAQSVNVVPEVSGRITWRSKTLVPGGRIKKGETFARMDGREYALAVAQEKGRVRSAQLELELEKGRGEVAAREWELLRGKKGDQKASPLALRTSQLEAAQINLESAKSGLARAQLNLERTSLRAPFNATVVSEDLDIGQRVGPNAAVARLVGTDEGWVRVGVRVEDLASIDIPGLNGDSGSPVKVTQRLSNGKTIEREGKVLRLVEELDPQTRRAQLLVSVPTPLAVGDGGLPLLPGAYVEVEIEGRGLDGVARVPSAAVYGGDTIWIVENSKLVRKNVEVRFSDNDFAFITGDIEAGVQVVTSPLSGPIDGMPVSATPTATAARE
ncbi:MAG: efflux RND transporter periplasmic adaptor subunit, partial [Myxococcota bacterium]